MATLFFFFLVWLAWKVIKALFRFLFRPRVKRVKTRYKPEYKPAGNSMQELLTLQQARETAQETVDYIDGLFCDPELIMNEKQIYYWLTQKASAEKRLAAIEKQISKITG